MLIDAMLILLIGTVTVLLPLSKAYRSRLRRRLMKQAEATIPREPWSFLESRVTRQSLMTGGAVLVAGLVVLALDRIWAIDGGNFFLVIFLAAAAGHTLADIVWPGAPGTGPRTARATTPTVAHYVPPHVRVWATVLVCFGVLAGAGTLLLSRSDSFDRDTILSSSVPALAVGLVLVVLLVRWATRRVLEAPQPARDEVELYWQDALRAQTLARLAEIPPVLSLLTCFICGSALWGAAWEVTPPAMQPSAWTLWLSVTIGVLPAIMVVVGAVVTVVRGGTWSEFRHVRDALWGGVAPDPRTQEVDA